MILAIAVSLLAVAGFGFVLWRVRIGQIAQAAVKTTMTGLAAMVDSELDDDAKEIAARRAGLALIGAAWGVLWRLGLALAAAAAPILLADALGLVPQRTVFDLMLRLDYIVIVSVLALVLAQILRRQQEPAADAEPDQPYSATDRFVHRLAFSSPGVLKAASRIDDLLSFGTGAQPHGPPIFVTSLARGGTTALLNALHDVPGVATHTYRDMPFLTAPRLWNRLAGGKKRQVERHQRAHGDGLEIDLDSPEAFEEVLWKMFWPEKFEGPVIALWEASDRNRDAERFFERHMAKIIRARGAGRAPSPARYCSKNNANIARIPYLAEAFPDCRIVVPLRRPESHAASLLRQHRNFLKRQAEDAFVRQYMRDIGHFEFGQIYKPIGFPGFEAGRHDPATADHWLDYWLQAFREVERHRDRCILVEQDTLRTDPQTTMEALCAAVDLTPNAMQFGGYFLSKPDHAETSPFDPGLYEEANALYAALARDGIGSAAPHRHATR